MHHHDPQPGDVFVNLSHGMFTKGAVVQLIKLKGGRAPYLCVPLTDNHCEFDNGPNGTPGAYVANLGKDNRFAFLAHVPLGRRRTPNAHGWTKGDLAIVTGTGDCHFNKGNIIKLSHDDRSDCPYFKLLHGEPKISPTEQHSVMYHRLARIKTWDEWQETDGARPVIRPGSYFECKHLDKDTFLAIAQAFVDAGMPRGELDRPYSHAAFKYFGWRGGKGGFFEDHRFPFCVDLFIRNPQDLIRSTSTQESTTMSTNPFKAGGKVVNCHRYSKPGSSEHYYGTHPVMEPWEREKAVLTVDHVDARCVRAGVEGSENFTYHPTELRLVTPDEIKAAEPKPPSAPAMKRGSIVKLKDGNVGFVMRATKDRDGDYNAVLLDQARSVFFKDHDIEAVLGSIEADGDFRPGTVQNADGPETWREGDVLECIDASDVLYINEGREYIVTALNGATHSGDGTKIRIRDNDGDFALYQMRRFRLKRRA